MAITFLEAILVMSLLCKAFSAFQETPNGVQEKLAMIRCPKCGWSYQPELASCPHCKQGENFFSPGSIENEADSSTEELAIAQFRNAAEAGFFSHELWRLEGIPTSLRAEEDYDGISGNWGTRYILMTSQPLASAAANILQELVQQSERGELTQPIVNEDHLSDATTPVWQEEIESADPFETGPGFPWVGLFLTLTAGTAMMLGGKKLLDQFQPRPAANAGPKQRDLWQELRGTGNPWTQEIHNGPGSRELRIHPDGNTAELREDRDGDGVFEFRQILRSPDVR